MAVQIRASQNLELCELLDQPEARPEAGNGTQMPKAPSKGNAPRAFHHCRYCHRLQSCCCRQAVVVAVVIVVGLGDTFLA